MSIRIHTSVPASTANLGPGYDVLGLALSLRLKTTATPAGEWSVVIVGEGAHLLDNCSENLIARACQQACEWNGWEAQPLRIESENPIPIARGLGSSAAAIVTGMALAQLTNLDRIDKDALFRDAAVMEGHPDNVAAAVYGGLQEVIQNGDGYKAHSRQLDNTVRILLAVPGSMKSTARLREIVPKELPAEVLAANDMALKQVLAGLAQGDAALLRYSEADKRHQPYRLGVQPESQAIFGLLQEIPGVAGVFLSGAGTAVGGWVLDEADYISQVEQLLKKRSISALVQVIPPDLKGIEGEIIKR
ncbi:MAG: homoserine kinase [Fidelibacterota bacterium]|nr:MAG: homoserine kinase [Candidatus Neomarinimicrobiota bacterium]